MDHNIKEFSQRDKEIGEGRRPKNQMRVGQKDCEQSSRCETLRGDWNRKVGVLSSFSRIILRVRSYCVSTSFLTSSSTCAARASEKGLPR